MDERLNELNLKTNLEELEGNIYENNCIPFDLVITERSSKTNSTLIDPSLGVKDCRLFNQQVFKVEVEKESISIVSNFTEHTVLNPCGAEVYNEKGNSKFNLGNKKGATSDWNKAAELRLKKRWMN